MGVGRFPDPSQDGWSRGRERRGSGWEVGVASVDPHPRKGHLSATVPQMSGKALKHTRPTGSLDVLRDDPKLHVSRSLDASRVLMDRTLSTPADTLVRVQSHPTPPEGPPSPDPAPHPLPTTHTTGPGWDSCHTRHTFCRTSSTTSWPSGSGTSTWSPSTLGTTPPVPPL